MSNAHSVLLCTLIVQLRRTNNSHQLVAERSRHRVLLVDIQTGKRQLFVFVEGNATKSIYLVGHGTEWSYSFLCHLQLALLFEVTFWPRQASKINVLWAVFIFAKRDFFYFGIPHIGLVKLECGRLNIIYQHEVVAL